MQSDKLPKMPDAKHFQVLSPIDSDRTHAHAEEVFTAQQMRDYALAARKAALEEVRAELNKRIDEMSRMERHRYLDGARGEAIAIELWLKELMEQGS